MSDSEKPQSWKERKQSIENVAQILSRAQELSYKALMD